MNKKAIVSLLVLSMVLVACGDTSSDEAAVEEVVEEAALTTLEEVQLEDSSSVVLAPVQLDLLK